MADQKTNNGLAISIAQQCTDFRHENQMKLCTLPLENTSNFSEASAIVKRYSFGKPNQLKCKTSKTILVMGATGSGKTTWINAMVNYVLGVEWDDPFRFILVDENLRGGSQANSQTQEVTAYDLHYQDGFRIPFSLTIVDTPGFGDTGGIAQDKEITTAIEELFRDENGIVELDAVGFVVQSALVRLTTSQKYIFNSVLGIFGKDVKENIRFLVTFSDGRKPPVLEAIKEAELPCRMDSKGLPCHQKFNNGAIYTNNQDEDDSMSPIEWKNGMTNFKSFFVGLSEMSITSLQLTKEVLANRRQLEMKLKWMQDGIPQHLTQMEELRKKEEIVRMHNVAIDANQNFEIKVKVAKKIQDPINSTALSCNSCERTCQDDCNPNTAIAHVEAFCEITGAFAAIPFLGLLALGIQHAVNAATDPQCKICKCVSSKHEKGQFRWICKDVEETHTVEEMRNNYEKAKGKKMDAEELVTALRNDVDNLKKEIIKTIDEIKVLHNELKNNALHGNPLTTPEYIRMMIENEKRECQKGSAERIKTLEELLPLTKMTYDIMEDATGFVKEQLKV